MAAGSLLRSWIPALIHLRHRSEVDKLCSLTLLVNLNDLEQITVCLCSAAKHAVQH